MLIRLKAIYFLVIAEELNYLGKFSTLFFVYNYFQIKHCEQKNAGMFRQWGKMKPRHGQIQHYEIGNFARRENRSHACAKYNSAKISNLTVKNKRCIR